MTSCWASGLSLVVSLSPCTCPKLWRYHWGESDTCKTKCPLTNIGYPDMRGCRLSLLAFPWALQYLLTIMVNIAVEILFISPNCSFAKHSHNLCKQTCKIKESSVPFYVVCGSAQISFFGAIWDYCVRDCLATVRSWRLK